MNIIRCQKCKAPLIVEEVPSHICFSGRIKAIEWYDWGECYAFDGKNWYRWFPERPLKRTTQDETRKDGTVPPTKCLNKTLG
jgi:hypothetical protein